MVNVPVFGGASGLFLDGDPLPVRALYLSGCGLLALAILVVAGATGTRLSVALRAIRDDEDAAAQFGVRPFRIKLLAFVGASFLMGMAGGLQGYKLGAIEPYGMFGLAWSVGTLSIVIIGGLGSRFGPVVGSVFVILLAEGLADYPELHVALTGLVLIVVIRFAPNGLCGLVSTVLKRRRGSGAAAVEGGRP
jgi:branched-chain amino acid transport system permease protein